MISGRGWSTLACCRESLRAEKWSSNGPLAGRSMGASGAGAPNQPELPAAANLPLVHPIALRERAGVLDQQGEALVGEEDVVHVELPAAQGGEARRRAGRPGAEGDAADDRGLDVGRDGRTGAEGGGGEDEAAGPAGAARGGAGRGAVLVHP